MRKVSIFKVVALTFMTIGCLVSCNQNTQNGPTVNEMQTRLNDIMKEYQEMQSTCDDYSRQLAAKDSSIQAQAAEIQRLIDQLGTAGKSTAVKGGRTAAKASPAQQRKLRAELKAKKAERLSGPGCFSGGPHVPSRRAVPQGILGALLSVQNIPRMPEVSDQGTPGFYR